MYREIECKSTTQLADFGRWTIGKASQLARLLLGCGNCDPDGSGFDAALRFGTAYAGHRKPDVSM